MRWQKLSRLIHQEEKWICFSAQAKELQWLCFDRTSRRRNRINSLTGSQAGIITNDRHNDARVIEVRPIRILDELDKGKVVVIGGFQGVSYKRDITTLGRGGSDTSAVALAAALKAERCEIYSDVDGVYTTDPKIVKDAKHLPEISYQQIQEMSEAGAGLNAQAVQFAKEEKISIICRRYLNPGKETIIKDVSKK